MLHSLRLHAPMLSVQHETLLFAQTLPVMGTTGLLVYRSVAIRDEDTYFQPVRELLASEPWRLAFDIEVDDPMMYFGRGYFTLSILADENQRPKQVPTWEELAEWAEEIFPAVQLRGAKIAG